MQLVSLQKFTPPLQHCPVVKSLAVIKMVMQHLPSKRPSLGGWSVLCPNSPGCRQRSDWKHGWADIAAVQQVHTMHFVELCVRQSEWYGRSLYDLIHADDIDKLREQLSTNDTQPPGRILDLKSMNSFTLHHLLFIQHCFIKIYTWCRVIALGLKQVLWNLAFLLHLFVKLSMLEHDIGIGGMSVHPSCADNVSNRWPLIWKTWKCRVFWQLSVKCQGCY